MTPERAEVRNTESRRFRFIAPAGLFVLAVAVRALPWPRVLAEARVYPFGYDAFYHLRRIVYSVVAFPKVLEFDPYINFPTGAKPIWTPFLDLLVSALCRPWVRDLADGGIGDIERFAVWVPPVLGGACVVAAYGLARRQFGFTPALISGIVLSLLSGHFWYSQIGFIDHHAAEALVTTLMLAAGMSLLRAAAGGQHGATRRRALWAGVLAACALLVWPGALLHVAILECGLFAFLLTRERHEDATRCAGWLAVLQGAALVCVAPFCLGNRWPQWGGLNPVVLSDFQPWLFALTGASLWIARRLWAVGALGASRLRRFGILAAVGSGLLAASLLLLPELRWGVADAWGWLAKREQFQLLVLESRPLLFEEGRLDLSTAALRLSCFFFLFPLALVALSFVVRRDRERAAIWLLLGWGAVLFAVTLLQRRFFNSFSVSLALVLAVSACWGHRALAARLGGSAGRRAALTLAFGAALFSLLLPSLRAYEPHLRNLRATVRGEKIVLSPMLSVMRAAIQMSAWMRNHTPETVGWLDPEQRPHYGVLAPWSMGHVLKYIARRPTVVDNFGDDVGHQNFAWSEAYYRSSEAEALPELDARQVRYVVVQQQHEQAMQEAPPPEALFYSLYSHDGSRFDSSAGGAGGVPALTRHRLVYESRGIHRVSSKEPPIFKVYEVVPGALVVGQAAPGATVHVQLGLRTNQGRRTSYAAEARADDRGHYELRLPYATREAPPSIEADPAYTFRCDTQTEFLVVGEADVRRGSVVAGPDLCVEGG